MILILAALAMASSSGPPATASEQVVEAVITAYEANRSAFASFGTISFRHYDGQATTLAEALEGKWRHRIEAQGLFVYAGNLARFEEVYPWEQALAQRVMTSENSWTMPLSRRLLTDGQMTFTDSISALPGQTTPHHSVSLLAGEPPFFHGRAFILQLRNPEPTANQLRADLDRVRDKKQGWTIDAMDQTAQMFGRDVAVITVTSAEGRRRYWIDLERGAIPLKIEDELFDKSTNFQGRSQVYSDIRQIPGRGWLPFRLTLYYSFHLVQEYVIDRVDFDQRPASESFRLTFDEPIDVIDAKKGLRYSPQKVWDLRALPSASSPQARQISLRRDFVPPGPAMQGERTGWFSWPTWLVVVGAVLLVGGVAARYMQRKAAL